MLKFLPILVATISIDAYVYISSRRLKTCSRPSVSCISMIRIRRTCQEGIFVCLSVCLLVCPGKYGRHTSLPFLRPPLTAALLTLGKAQQVDPPPAPAPALISGAFARVFWLCFTVVCAFALQSAMLGNGLVLQNLLHMQLAQQQLLHIKDKRISSVRPKHLDLVWVQSRENATAAPINDSSLSFLLFLLFLAAGLQPARGPVQAAGAEGVVSAAPRPAAAGEGPPGRLPFR